MSKSDIKLFVIIDPTSDHQIALEKALSIARLSDCEIHAYLCVYEDISEHGEYASIKDMKKRVLARAQKRVDFLMQRCQQNNIHYATEVVWNKYWYEAAIQAAASAGCDLVIKSSLHHSKAKRFFNKTSDFSLMRYCASPILFTHQSQKWHSNRVLACVDLESGDDQHIRLNNSVIRTAKAMVEMLDMELTIAAAYKNKINKRFLRDEKINSGSITEQLARIFDLDPEHMIIRQGSTVDTIVEICAEIDPGLLVLGSIARTGISGKLIGNTAEKLLDVIDIDILTTS